MVHCWSINGSCKPQVPSDFSTLPHQLSHFQDEILFPEFGWICILCVLWHVPVLRSFAVQFSCDLELYSLVGGKLRVVVCVVCALYLKLLLYSP
jgi:hypothetical protein